MIEKLIELDQFQMHAEEILKSPDASSEEKTFIKKRQKAISEITDALLESIYCLLSLTGRKDDLVLMNILVKRSHIKKLLDS
jgi:diphthamide synthase subunit DPH2